MNLYEYHPGLDVREVEKYLASHPDLKKLADDAAERQRIMTDKDMRKSIDKLVRDTANADD